MHTIEENHLTLPEGISLDGSGLSEKHKHETTQLFTTWTKSLLDIRHT